MNEKQQEFINILIDAIEYGNDCFNLDNEKIVDVPFVISVVKQNIDKINDFIIDIDSHKGGYSINFKPPIKDEWHSNGCVEIRSEKPCTCEADVWEYGCNCDTYVNYYYKMSFGIYTVKFLNPIAIV